MRFIWLFLFIFLSPLIILFFHSLFVRIFYFFKRKTSQMTIVIFSIIFTNIPILVISLIILNFDFKNIFSYIYVLLTFNLLGYLYFSIFGLSESSIRIKAIILIKKNQIKNINDLKQCYSENSTEVRLEKLVKWNHIEKVGDDSYILKKYFLFFISKILIFFRFLLGLNNSINDKYL